MNGKCERCGFPGEVVEVEFNFKEAGTQAHYHFPALVCANVSVCLKRTSIGREEPDMVSSG